MRALLALPSVRTEARKVEPAQRLPHVLLAAILAQGAESLVVMRTRRQSRCGVDVQIIAVLAADAVAAAIVVGTLCSGPYVVFVQVIALVALLAEAFQPVLADEVVVVVVAVLVGTVIAQRAEALAVRLTYWSVGVETEAVFAFEEVGEGEVVGRRLWGFGEAFVTEVHRRSSSVVDCDGHRV